MDLVLDSIVIAAPDGRTLIDSASLVFREGVTTLIGENGAGKSTLLRAVFDLHLLVAGTIRFGSLDHRRNRSAFLEQAVFMPQNFAAYPELTGREFLEYFLRLRGVSKRAAVDRARGWLAAVGIESAAETKTGTYSQGMLQRLGFAYAMQSGARLCVLDEPFAGVDPSARITLMNILFDTPTDRVTILCTHHVEEMAARGASIVRIANGGIALDRPVAAC